MHACQECYQGNGTVRHMQAGKAEKQPPTHSTGDTAHADSTAVSGVCRFWEAQLVATSSMFLLMNFISMCNFTAVFEQRFPV
jgi:hypothetical protein